MAITMPGGIYFRRLMGAAALDPGTYEEIESDQTATTQAFATVILAGLAGGVGTIGFGGTLRSVAFMGAIALLTWGIWAVITFEIGVRVMPRPETRSDVGELLRTIGVFTLTAIWMLSAMTVGVRQALDLDSTGRALAVCGVGWGLVIGIVLALGLAFGPSLR